MKVLYLLRHAKSSWDEPGLNDFERPLNERGRRAAKIMGDYFRARKIRPDAVLCSSACRTRQTYELIAKKLSPGLVVFEDALYEAGAAALFDRVQRLPHEMGSVMLIGHNPALERLALSLINRTEADQSAFEALAAKYPTAALTMMTAPIDDWGDLAPGICRLDAFVRPRDVEKRD